MAGASTYHSDAKGKLVGVDIVLKRLNAEIAKIENRTKAGLRDCALTVKRHSVLLTPNHIGNLVGSAYTEVFDNPLSAVIGYTSEYAPWVHEAPGTLKGQPRPKRNGKDQGLFWGPKGEPQFLRKALYRNQGYILRTLKEYARIAGGGK